MWVVKMKKNTANITRDDMHRADIVAALKKKGWSVRALSRESGLHESTLYSALKTPYPKCERIIAEALGLEPEEIWPQRYAARNFQPMLPKAAND